MYVCICSAVTDDQVTACIAAGAATAEEIGRRCRAGLDCGSCLEHLDDLLEARPADDRAA